MMRLQAGLREPAYEASVRNMLAGGLLGEEELNIYQNDNKKNPKNSKETKISKKVEKEDKEKNRLHRTTSLALLSDISL